MSEIDQKYLRQDQYRDASRLSARARLHALYSRNPYDWFQWMFDLYHFPANARILELGAGAGWLWLNNAPRIPLGWEITLSDLSQGMLNDLRQALAVVPRPFAFMEIDAQAIPYPDASFDGLIANNMLYHVPDRARAIAEMRRVLRPGGILYTATNGENNVKEIRQLMQNFGFQPDEWLISAPSARSYTLENAPDQLRAQFPHVEVVRYDDTIEVNDADVLVDFILSYPLRLSDERLAALRAFVGAEVGRTGTMTITSDMGVVIAHA